MHRSLGAAKLGHSTLHHFSFVSAPKNIDTQNQPNPVDESVSKHVDEILMRTTQIFLTNKIVS